jgi:hypothetical protein
MGFTFAMTENFIREMLHHKRKHSILLAGPYGVGKSACFRSAAKKEDVPYIDQRLSQCDVGDMKGFPFLYHGRTCFAPPEWFPLQEVDIADLMKKLNLSATDMIRHAKAGILLLDEIDRGTREVQQAGFEVVLDRRLNGKPIKEDWLIGAGVNADGDVYHVNDMDISFIDRFAYVIFSPTQDEFFNHARGEGHFHQAVLNFLVTYPTFIDPSKEYILNNPGKKLYSRRSWDRFSEFLQDHESYAQEVKDSVNILDGKLETSPLLLAFAESYVGHDAAARFRGFVATNYKSLGPDVILNKWDDSTEKAITKLIAAKEITEVASICKLIINYVEDKKLTKLTEKQEHNLSEFYCLIPNEVASGFFSPFMASCKEAATAWFTGRDKIRLEAKTKTAYADTSRR